jgi:hypothetical protein
MTDDRYNLVAFLAVIIAIVLLSKIGGSGADLAIMTGLIGVLGTFRPGQRKVEMDQPDNKPIPTKDTEEPKE